MSVPDNYSTAGGGSGYPSGGSAYSDGGSPYTGGSAYPGGGPAYPGGSPAYPGGGPSYQGGWGTAGAEPVTGPIPRIDAGAGRPEAPGATLKVDPAKLLGLAVAVLGALNFVWGFLPEVTAARSNESLSVFAVGPAYVPVLLLIAGLLALAAFLPGSERSRLAVAAVSVGGAAGAIVSLGTAGSVELVTTAQVGKGLGAILLVVFGIVQAVVAIGAYVIGADFSQSGHSGPQARAGSAGSAAAAAAWSAGQPGGPQTFGQQTFGAPAAPAPAWQSDPAVQPGWTAAPAGPVWQPNDRTPNDRTPDDRTPNVRAPGDQTQDVGAPAADDSDTGPQPAVQSEAARPVDSPEPVKNTGPDLHKH